MNIKLKSAHSCFGERYDTATNFQFIKKKLFFLKCARFSKNDWQLLNIVVNIFQFVNYSQHTKCVAFILMRFVENFVFAYLLQYGLRMHANAKCWTITKIWPNFHATKVKWIVILTSLAWNDVKDNTIKWANKTTLELYP